MITTLIAFSALTMHGEALDYQSSDGTMLEGYLSVPTGTGAAPAVIIIHDWDGLNDYEKMRAEMVTREFGAVGFAADIYGKGVRPTTRDENSAQAGKYYSNPMLYRERIQAAIDAVKAHPRVDDDRVVVIGYCFGGTGALETARMNADVAGVTSFHGGLGKLIPDEATPITTNVLVCHAAFDPSVSKEQFNAFVDEMAARKAEYEINVYNATTHPFTVVGGSGYNEKADKSSWARFSRFLKDLGF